jgi:hypothetical protein
MSVASADAGSSPSPVDLGAWRRDGWVRADRVVAEARLASLRPVVQRLAGMRVRPERLSGVHNPYGLHAGCQDAWHFLALAESGEALDVVEAVLGPDLVLWDSSLGGQTVSAEEARWWPVDPLAGALALVDLEDGSLTLVDVTRLESAVAHLPAARDPLYVIRYMPATSRFDRSPELAANRRAAAERPLINYANRPIWLVRGRDRAGNDFATGFSPPAPRWGAGAAAA